MRFTMRRGVRGTVPGRSPRGRTDASTSRVRRWTGSTHGRWWALRSSCREVGLPSPGRHPRPRRGHVRDFRSATGFAAQVAVDARSGRQMTPATLRRCLDVLTRPGGLRWAHDPDIAERRQGQIGWGDEELAREAGLGKTTVYCFLRGTPVAAATRRRIDAALASSAAREATRDAQCSRGPPPLHRALLRAQPLHKEGVAEDRVTPPLAKSARSPHPRARRHRSASARRRFEISTPRAGEPVLARRRQVPVRRRRAAWITSGPVGLLLPVERSIVAVSATNRSRSSGITAVQVWPSGAGVR